MSHTPQSEILIYVIAFYNDIRSPPLQLTIGTIFDADFINCVNYVFASHLTEHFHFTKYAWKLVVRLFLRIEPTIVSSSCRKSKSAWMLCTVTILRRWRSSKIGLTSFNVKNFHDLVLADRRLKVREITGRIDISKDCVGHILHEILDMRKLSARWVPRFSHSGQQAQPWNHFRVVFDAV